MTLLLYASWGSQCEHCVRDFDNRGLLRKMYCAPIEMGCDMVSFEFVNLLNKPVQSAF